MTRRRGHVLERARGWYAVASFTDDAGRRYRPRSGPHETRRGAEQALAELLADLQRGAYIRPDRTPLGEYLITWLEGRRHDLKASTWNGYAGVIARYIRPTIGGVVMKDVKSAHIAKLYSGMAGRGLSARTIRTVHVVLRRALEDALREGAIARNPAATVRLPRTRAPEMKVWSAEQVRTFLTATRDHEMHALFTVALTCGLRRGELAGLRWGDIDFERGTMAVRRTIVVVDGRLVEDEPKTARSRRVIDVDDRTLHTLRSWRVQQAEGDLRRVRKDARVFGWRPEEVSAAFSRAARRAKLPGLRLHDARHTCASLMLGAGIPVHVVAARLGHSSAVTTWAVYAHITSRDDAAAAEVLRRLVFGNS